VARKKGKVDFKTGKASRRNNTTGHEKLTLVCLRNDSRGISAAML